MLSQHDRELLRQLAGRVREITDSPEMRAKRQLLRELNGLKADRPVVLCMPEGSWSELLPSDQLECEDPMARGWERRLRQAIYYETDIRDDSARDPQFNLPWVVSNDGYGVDVPHHRAEEAGSYVWDAPIKNIADDFHKLHFRNWSVDREETARRMELANETFGDLLPPRLRHKFGWTVGMTWEVAKLIGLEQLMMFMYDDPEGLHRLMAWMRDEHAAGLDFTEREGLLTAWNEGDYVGSGGYGYTDELPGENVTSLRDTWGFAESQETVGISPEMFEEFVLPYQVPLLERFGLNCYGCCEPVHQRIDAILRDVPRLRRVSAAPMVDQAALKEKLGDSIIFSRKPNPILVCNVFDEQLIRQDIRKTLAIAGHGPLEIILKDTHTVQNEPWRINRWVEIAKEEVEAFVSSAV